jgi:uncharacterized repeat protein (TIGR01451 family)
MPNVRRLTTLLWLIPALLLAADASNRAAFAQTPSGIPPFPPAGETAPPVPDLINPPPGTKTPAPDVPEEARSSAPAPGDPARSPKGTIDRNARPASSNSNNLEPQPLDGGLAPAKDRPGAPVPPAEAGPVDRAALAADRLPMGKQTFGLSIDVVAPAVMNVGREATVKILVKNTGVADASDVRIRYDLPRELEFLSSQPADPKRFTPEDPSLTWMISTLSAGSDQIIALKVKPKEVSTIDHTSHVTLVVGGRSRSVIQEPKLLVEMPPPTPSKLLKGQQAKFRISVTNPGSGPARNVIIQAKLSSGLTAEGADSVDQTIAILQPRETVELDELQVDTIAGGDQTVTVTANSPDVAEDAKKTQHLTVLRPELEMKLTGPQTRYTDTVAEYQVLVTNPGTAAAKNVKVAVTLPANSGRLLKPLPAGATWDKASQKISWTIPNIEPARAGEPGKSMATFHVQLAGPTMYRVVAEAKSGVLVAKGAVSTDVSGIANIKLDVSERKGILDVGETTVFDIKMRNNGTKEAKGVIVKAHFSDNVEIMDVAGVEVDPTIDKVSGALLFPQIDSLAPNRELALSVRVKVKGAAPPMARCQVTVHHNDIPDGGSLEDIASTRITGDPTTRVK